MTGRLTPEVRTARLLELLDLARVARGLLLEKTAELEPKLGELLALALCPDPEPRRIVQSLVLGGWLGFDHKAELLAAVLDAEYPGVVGADFRAKLGNLTSLRNA